MSEKLQPEAFVEVNGPHVAVRMRRPVTFDEWHLLVMGDVGVMVGHAQVFEGVTVTRPRASSDGGTWNAAYFEIWGAENADGVADALKIHLDLLGYTLTKERFPV